MQSFRRSRIYKNKTRNRILEQFLKDLRIERKVNQKELASRLSVPQSFISKYETGERDLNYFEIRLICEALDISIFDFVKQLEERIKDNETSTSI